MVSRGLERWRGREVERESGREGERERGRGTDRSEAEVHEQLERVRMRE